MKKSDIVKEIQPGQYLITGSELWEMRDEEAAKEHGIARTARVFQVVDEDTLKELPINKMIKEIIAALADHIDVREFLGEVLRQNTPVEDIIRAHKVISKHPEAAKAATPRMGCFYLDLPDPSPGQEKVSIYLMR